MAGDDARISIENHSRCIYTGKGILSFIHSGYFYRASSSPLLLRGTPDYSIDTVS